MATDIVRVQSADKECETKDTTLGSGSAEPKSSGTIKFTTQQELHTHIRNQHADSS